MKSAKSGSVSYTKLATAIAFACGATLPSYIFAQDTELEEIVVTGSFISRPADRPQPVAIMDAAEIRANQRISTIEVLRDMPQISSANVVENWNTPTNSIDMRGLGARSTLVLLNGQRQTIDANSASQVDVNNLAPAIMLERIELVLDGASALYGSDAVAGVANFITRNNFEGVEFSVSSQFASAQSDVPEVLVGGLMGVQQSDFGVVMGFEYLKRNKEMQSADVFSNERLGEGLITGLYNPGTFGAIGPPRAGDTRVRGGWFADPLCGSPLIGGLEENVIWDPAGATNHNGDGLPVAFNPFCRGTLSLQRTIIPENDRFTGMTVATRDFAGGTSLTWELNYARVQTHSSFGTGVPLLALPSLGAVLPPENPGVIDANQRNPNFPVQHYSRVFSRQASPLEGSLPSFAEQNTFRSSTTLTGPLNDNWEWRVNGSASWNSQESGTSDTIADRYARAIQGYGGGNCKFDTVSGAANNPNVGPGVGNCQWWNPFASRLIAEPGDPTYNSPALADWMTYNVIRRGDADFFSVEALITGSLWEMAGGTSGLAVGVQYRQQELDYRVDPVAKDGGYGFAPQVVQDWFASRETEAVFAELVMFPTEDLELDFAVRYEDTNGLSSTEPKFTGLWTPADNVFIRFSVGSSFRLASERQTFGIGPSGTTIRPLGGEVTQARALSVGNPDLLPEESDNWTVGFTWDITDDLTFDVTYWSYEFTNLVSTIDPDEILLADIADGFITDPRIELFPGVPNEVCEISGRWDEDSGDPLPAGCLDGFDIALFKSSFVNRNAVETSGLDVTFDWRKDMSGGGLFGLRLVASYADSFKVSDLQGNLIEAIGTTRGADLGLSNNPQIRANLIATYARGNHAIRWSTRFTDGIELYLPGRFEYNTDESSWSQHDAVYTYTLPSSNQVNLAVLNVMDNEVPLRANSLTTVRSNLYDPRMRMVRLEYTHSF
ncbi:TonB-dependent receptor plug domain-containing protein [Candidatus Rariloculus sp.]|uniref:TonB-dependent receptor plug domain-containing protein n=1 Tax=Candidatus Rariloculus sp. TaxID=3101265 RepID=UPI003D132F05